MSPGGCGLTLRLRLRNACGHAVQAGAGDDVLDQHSLLPSATADPKLWMVKCVSGSEKEIVAQLMSKYIAFALRGQPLGIFSAFCHDLPPSASPPRPVAAGYEPFVALGRHLPRRLLLWRCCCIRRRGMFTWVWDLLCLILCLRVLASSSVQAR